MSREENLDSIQLYNQMYKIRFFEETLLDIFSKGLVNGTTHTYIGQEANAVGIINNLNANTDIIISNHRCHGHYLSFTNDVKGLLFEIIGLPDGVCSGKGGSQHICKDNFYSNGILGGMMPIATGLALSKKIKKEVGIVVAFLGDGMLGEGAVYESLNIASLWKLPLLFIVENNKYAQSTPIELQLSGSIKSRFDAFDIRNNQIDTTDVFEVMENSNNAINFVRNEKLPYGLIIDTYRFSAHSKGDDNRDPIEIAKHKKLDPLLVFRNKFPELDYDKIQSEIRFEINDILEEGIAKTNK